MNLKFFHSLDLEWKILILAITLFVAFFLPLQGMYIKYTRVVLEQSIDPNLDEILCNALSSADSTAHQQIITSIERQRQWKALIPIIISEQHRSTLGFSVVLFILFIGIALYTLKRLTQPLTKLSKAADQIGSGKFVPIAMSSGGALGHLEKSMFEMQNELKAFRNRAQAEGMEQAWRDIARVMAHEIKNPLTPIRLILDRITEKIDNNLEIESAELTKYIGRITSQVEHLELLVNSFKSFAKDPEVNLKNVEIRKLIETIGSDLENKITTIIEGNAVVFIDSRLFNQVLLNLWKNAIEANATQISTSIQATETEVSISIHDNGCGISPDKVRTVWVPYSTSKKGGTGLGLPVVKRLIESMHGTIILQESSQDDSGAHFILKFSRTENSYQKHEAINFSHQFLPAHVPGASNEDTDCR